MHWTDQTSGGGRAGLLPGQARDPHSGQPGFKNTPGDDPAVATALARFLVSASGRAVPRLRLLDAGARGAVAG